MIFFKAFAYNINSHWSIGAKLVSPMQRLLASRHSKCGAGAITRDATSPGEGEASCNPLRERKTGRQKALGNRRPLGLTTPNVLKLYRNAATCSLGCCCQDDGLAAFWYIWKKKRVKICLNTNLSRTVKNPPPATRFVTGSCATSGLSSPLIRVLAQISPDSAGAATAAPGAGGTTPVRTTVSASPKSR